MLGEQRYRGISVGDKVYILAGENKGEWGIVKLILAEEFHVGLANGSADMIFERAELRKPRK